MYMYGLTQLPKDITIPGARQSGECHTDTGVNVPGGACCCTWKPEGTGTDNNWLGGSCSLLINICEWTKGCLWLPQHSNQPVTFSPWGFKPYFFTVGLQPNGKETQIETDFIEAPWDHFKDEPHRSNLIISLCNILMIEPHHEYM